MKYIRPYLVWSVLTYLKFWAKVALKLHRPYIIGVAGSAGKSSARNALFAILSEYKKVKAVTGNSETGVPLGILGINLEGYNTKDWYHAMLQAPKGIHTLRNIDYLIVEMGIDDPHPPKNMTYLLSIVKPDLAISLNVAGPHLMQFEKTLYKAPKTIKSDPEKRLDYILTKMAEEDTKIITNSHCKAGIYNDDNIYVKNAIERKKLKNTKLLKFGRDKNNDISYLDYDISPKRTKFLYKFGDRQLELVFRGFVLPQAYQETFAAVILACFEAGLSFTQIKSAIEKNFLLPKGRASVFDGIVGCTIIDSTYNAPKLAVLSFLEMLKILKEKTGRPTIAVIGDMRELGNQAEIEHQEVAEKLLKTADYVYCVGPLTQQFIVPTIKDGLGKKKNITKRVDWYKNAVQLGLHIKEDLPTNSIILFKGSQNEIFLEEAIKFLLQNANDAKNLTRQDDYWMSVKKEFFSV